MSHPFGSRDFALAVDTGVLGAAQEVAICQGGTADPMIWARAAISNEATLASDGIACLLKADEMICGIVVRERNGHALDFTLGTAAGLSDLLHAGHVNAGGVLGISSDSLDGTSVFDVDTNIYVSSTAWGGASVKVKVIHG